MKKVKTLAQNVALNLHEINEMIVNGEGDALETFIHLKRIERLFKDVFKGAQDLAIEEAQKEGGTFQRFNAEIQNKTGAKMWDFKGCKQWADKKAELVAIEGDLKNAFALYERGKQSFDDETGEQVDIPHVTYKADNITIKLFKE